MVVHPFSDREAIRIAAEIERKGERFYRMALGVAKDGSLAALLEHMGLGRENLMACGDGLNDRSMIEYAGVGVAMQNAEEPVKAVADYVTAADNDHDGVAEAVEKFIL